MFEIGFIKGSRLNANAFDLLSRFQTKYGVSLKGNEIRCAVWAMTEKGKIGLYYHLTWYLGTK